MTRPLQAASDTSTTKSFDQPILLTGATGYVGSRLQPLLEQRGHPLRCLTRNPHSIPTQAEQTTAQQGNVLEPESLQAAMAGVHTAYYLVHLMAAGDNFEQQDRVAAQNFARAARAAGVQRIIYLGGLGEESDPGLSRHLASRHEVGRILRSSGVVTIELRASVLIGAGNLSFEMIRALTDRLPVMICPKWLSTPTQPIGIDDVLAYLVAAQSFPTENSRVFEIGAPDVLTYGELIREYARQANLKRWLIKVPLLTPYLSSLWLGLVTPATAEVGRHLIEGLRNPTIVRDYAARTEFDIQPLTVAEAMRRALQASTSAS